MLVKGFLNSDIIGRLMQHRAEIVVVDESESTNTQAFGLVSRAELRPPFVLLARRQSAGHGRLGRRWFSEEGASLCMSAVVAIPQSARAIESFTVRAGVEICSRLRREFGADVFLKWPNDIYDSEGRKIAGMLAELFIEGGVRTVVFGVGINYNLAEVAAEKIPPELVGNIRDILSVSSRDFTMDALAAAVADGAYAAADSLDGANFAESFADFDWLNGRSVEFTIGNERISGVARGVDDLGHLLLETDSGYLRVLKSGEATTKR